MKRWRSIRRKIAKSSNRRGIYSHSIWNNFRKPGICLVVTVILLITKGGVLYTYGGEFGGFDIDIGADEGIFDNWEEEVEENQEATETEQKENGGSNGNESNNNSNNDSVNGGNSSNDIENDGNNNSYNSGSSNDNYSGNNNGNNNNGNNNNSNNNNSNNNNNNSSSNSNAGAGLSKTENGDNTGDKDGWGKPQAADSERKPKENKKEIKKENSVTSASPANKNAENKKTNINADNSANGTAPKSNTTKKTPRVKKDSSKSKEEKSGDTAADENISENGIAARETKNTDRKKADMSKAKITESPKKENTSEHLKLTGAGTAFTAVGMAKISRKLGFYNKNDENIEKNENINKNNNINDNKNGAIRFTHKETVPVNEYPEIQVIRTTGEQDVTILSLNLNGDEIFWHQEGDTLVFDQPITAKENTVKVIAVIDGRRIVHMPIWEF